MIIRKPGGKYQVAVLRTLAVADDDRGFKADTRMKQLSCMRAADRGLLKRDPKDSFTWHLTDYGRAKIQEYDDKLARKAGIE